MSNLFFIEDFPEGHGGAEQVNNVVAARFGSKWLRSHELKEGELSKDDFYILGNLSLLRPAVLEEIKKLNYVILEHDYKICDTRHPWRHTDSLIPKELRINYDLYENAKAIFVQTNDHLDVFKKNEVEGNFINLSSTLWSDEDLELLKRYNTTSPRNLEYGILNSSNWIKNTKGAVKFCSDHKVDYKIIEATDDRDQFINNMSQFSTLVFFPIARESCCRLVVEARCLRMNVITSMNYGAVLEPWFSKSGDDLISFLRENTTANLEKIGEYIEN